MSQLLTLREAQDIYGQFGPGEFNFACPSCGGIEFLLRLDLSRGCVISVCVQGCDGIAGRAFKLAAE